MTINEDVPGIHVAVQINGVDVAEYEAPDAGDEDAPVPTVTKYIECIDNAKFTIRMGVNRAYEWGYRNHALSLQVYVDGHWVIGKLFKSPTAPDAGFFPPAEETVIRGREEINPSTNEWVLRNFKFASVTTGMTSCLPRGSTGGVQLTKPSLVDEAQQERVKADLKIASKLGIIEVKVLRGIVGGEVVSRPGNIKNNKFELSEKSLKGKAVSHGTNFERGTRLDRAPRYSDFQPLPEDRGPIAIFRLIYRSREALKREMIIPRTPPPRSPRLAALTDAERDRLARERLEQLKGTKVKREGDAPIKREHGEHYDLTQDSAPARPSKRTRLNSGEEVELIDLTDD
ncbi:uncharacterized protein PG986_009023 [Apiospora aurea]|uniref:DUF7918 domain-containing protein n=1 Tax=Apiospora aurea TaxID=335848 RepID=A0ABR1Q6F3_9PEZI